MDALATPTAAPPILYGAPAPPGELLPWSWAEQRLVAARTYWIATTRPMAVRIVDPCGGCG